MANLIKTVVDQSGGQHLFEDKHIVKSFEMLGRERYGEAFSGDSIVDQVAKAVATASVGSFGSLSTMLLENLDATMTSVLFQKKHLKLFNSIPRVPTAQTLFQWTRQLEYGTGRGALGFPEGGSPATFLPSFMRGNATTRFYGVRRGYTHQMIQVGIQGGSFIDPVAEENRSGTLDLLNKLERWLVFGDSNMLYTDGSSVHYDGLLKQITTNYPSHIYDLQGAPLSFENIENYAQELVTTGQLIDFSNLRCFMAPRVASDLAKFNLQNQFFWQNSINQPNGWRPGIPLNGYATQHGVVPFEESIFLDPVPFGKVNNQLNPSTGQYAVYSDAGAPAIPQANQISITTPSTPSGATNNLAAGTTFYYFVSAVNPNGESGVLTGAAALSSVTPSSGQVVEIQITTGVPGATAYRIYRGASSNALDTSVGWVATIYPTAPGGTMSTGSLSSTNMNTPGNAYVDVNQVVPGCNRMLMLNLSEEDIAIPQLAPLIKFPIAIVSTTIEFFLILYHTLAVKAPERMIAVINIGQRP